MSESTKIEWCDSTFNPWIGCTKVSIETQGGGGCDHCYAHHETPVRVLRGRGHETFGPGALRQRTSTAYWKQPLRWNAQAAEFEAQHGRRRRVFCASLADVFDNEVDPAWRADLFALISATPALDWLLLTKRIGNVNKMVEPFGGFTRGLPANVWLGATVVNSAEADRDIPKLLATPAARRFLSIEPLLGPIDLEFDHPSARHASSRGAVIDALDWVIVGGESGPHARPASPEWFRSIRDQCSRAGVPFLMKQWGEWIPMLGQAEGIAVRDKATTTDGWVVGRAGKKVSGRLLDGVEHNGFPRSAA